MNSLIISPSGTINAFVNGKSYSLSPGAYYYPSALEAAKCRDYDKLIEAINLDQAVKSKSNGKVSFEDGILRYNGSYIDNKLSRRVLQLISEGYRLEPFIKFMDLCYQNPNPTVVDNLYDFMETSGIMLDEEGWVVGWKKVNSDGYDLHSGKVLYEVGKTVKIDRSSCDERTANSCSYGLHVGSKNYSESFHSGVGKILLVRLNPKNVVCVPEYSQWEKLRTCEMEVLEEFKVDKNYNTSVYLRDVQNVYGNPECPYHEDSNEDCDEYCDRDCDEDCDEDCNEEPCEQLMSKGYWVNSKGFGNTPPPPCNNPESAETNNNEFAAECNLEIKSELSHLASVLKGFIDTTNVLTSALNDLAKYQRS